MQIANFLKNTKHEVPCATPQIDNRALRAETPGARLSDQIKHKRCIDGRLLSRFEIAESLDLRPKRILIS